MILLLGSKYRVNFILSLSFFNLSLSHTEYLSSLVFIGNLDQSLSAAVLVQFCASLWAAYRCIISPEIPYSGTFSPNDIVDYCLLRRIGVYYLSIYPFISLSIYTSIDLLAFNMSSLEKISADLNIQELKTTRVYKAIHSLLVEWKDFEDHINATQDSFDQCLNELESRERNLNSTEEYVSESISELELLWKSIEKRLKQAAHNENEFKLIFEKQRKEFNLKQKRLIFVSEINSVERREP